MFKNLKWNAENVWVGEVVFKFYHAQKCPHCDYAGKGFNDLKSEGPWDFECINCRKEWSVVMTTMKKYKRRRLLRTLTQIDELIEDAKGLGGHIKR